MRLVSVVAAAVLAALLLAAPADAHTSPGADEAPAPYLRSASPEQVVATRSRFFGAENVDQTTGQVRRDRVLFSWFGVTNFAVAIRGHVVLFDAWVPRGLNENWVPTSPGEVAELDPELIILGHAHFDHAADALPIARASGAAIVGLGEHCAEMVKRSNGMPPRCIEVIRGGAPAGAKATLELLPGIEVTAVKHIHSAIGLPDGGDGYHVPVLPPLTTSPLTHPPSPATVVETVGRIPDAEGGSVLYRFQVGDKSFVWHDSSGPMKEEAPGAFDVLRELRPVDVELGAIQGFNQLTNGLRDPRMYIDALRPRIFVPTHHDDWLPGITGPGAGYRQPLMTELERLPAEARPQVRFIQDPRDYLTADALTFPVRFEPLAATRRCVRGRLRARLGGDTADVERVVFKLGAAKRTVESAPWQATFPRRESRRAGRRVRATVVEAGGRQTSLRRAAPRCAR